MSMDIDNAGGLIVAGLAAGEIEGAAARKDKHDEHAGQCANCQAALAGPFCASCGQRAHLHRSLLHFGEELLHGILHFDAKAWRTLPMLIGKPGVLTRRYIDGQRVRYVSPLALFLFMVFFMFFVVSWAKHDKTDFDKISTKISTKIDSKVAKSKMLTARANLEASIAREQTALAKAESALAATRTAGKDPADAIDGVADARESLETAQGALHAFDKVNAKLADIDTGNSAPDDKMKAAHSTNFNVKDTGFPSVDEALKHAIANPELTLYKLKNSASKFSFLLVPISLPFLWLMFFWKRNVTLYDHAVFSLYSLSFMAVLVSVIALLGAAGLSVVVGLLICFVPPIHIYFQLRDTYNLRRFSALWRTVALLFVCLLVFIVYLLIISMLSMR